MYLISKILFGTPSTLSDLDDIECPNQFELLGNGGKRMKERKLVYSRVPKKQICPEEQGCADGHQKQNCAAVPEASMNEEIKKVVAMLPETFAAYQRSSVLPPGFVKSWEPCCKRNKINGSSPCIILNRPAIYDCCKECKRINLFIAEQYSDVPPYYIIVDPKTFLSANNDNKLPKPQSQSPSPLSSPTCVERRSRSPGRLGKEMALLHLRSKRGSSPPPMGAKRNWVPRDSRQEDAARMRSWSTQSPSCLHSLLGEDDTHSQLEGATERLVKNLKSSLPNPEDFPKGFKIAEGPCCEKAVNCAGNIAIKSSANLTHMPALCPEHRHCGVFPLVIEMTRRGPRSIKFPGRYVNWNEQAATDAKKIVKFLMSPLSDEKNLPDGYRVVYKPCCIEANKHPVEIPVEIPVPGEKDKTINVAYCPKDKQFHIYRDNIYARHVVWNPSKKSGSDLIVKQ